MINLVENLTYDEAKIVVESANEGKNLFMKGIFIEGGVKNANQRVYPVNEIQKAVETVNEQIKGGYSVLGEVDHPDGLNINLDRVSHMIEGMWCEDSKGFGKLKILETPMGQLVKTLLEGGVKLGVSSRGSGNVKEDGSGQVSDFEIVTVDIVAQPSAPSAYPSPIYEHLLNTKGGYKALQLGREVQDDAKAQKYLKESLVNIISGLQ
jgi:hypothetical protein